MFAREESMMDPVLNLAARRWGSKDYEWVLLREQQAETSIPDVVVARVAIGALHQRSADGHLRPLNRSELLTLRSLARTKAATLTTVSRRSYLGEESAARILRRLEREGRVDRSATGSWIRTGPLPCIVTHAVSLEVKRSDWRKALFQARGYRAFANEAYVVFDGAFEARFRRRVGAYAHYGIGLIAMDAATLRTTSLLPAQASRPRDPLAAALFGERVLGALLGFESRSTPQSSLPGASAQIAHQEVVQQIGSLLAALRPRLVACAGLQAG